MIIFSDRNKIASIYQGKICKSLKKVKYLKKEYFYWI